MNKTVKFGWFVIFLSCMSNFKSVFSGESVPVHYKGKYTSDIKNYEIVVPQRVNKDGSFISHLVSHHHSKRSTKELDFIFYKIPIGGRDYLIELTPNRKLISPGAVVEVHRRDVRKLVNRKLSNQTMNNETVTKMFKNLDIKKLENTDCHFSGHIKGENTSKAALSTCYGLAGFIQTHKGFYIIEPVAEHNPFLEDAYPHILYKTDRLDNSSVCHTMGELGATVDGLVRKRRESSAGLPSPVYIETLIVMDKTFINYYEDSDCENYVLTVFNMAFNLFHDASSGSMMTLTLVRLIRLEIENDEMNLKVNADAEKSLRYFQTWQYDINPGDDSHPNHHDIAVLVTKVNVCYSPSACGLLGLTTIGKGCDPKLSATLCEDTGLRLGYVIAHQIGHLLGADHDSINSTCNGTDADGLKTVMHPHISTTTQTWSSCSQAYFKEFFSSGKGNCFLDEPEEHHFNVHDLLPGVMYDADFQCKHLITVNARECDMGSTCDSLNCHVPGYACVITHAPPADGTHCGENMWCRNNKCIVVGERPGAIDGNWGEWSAWSDCSRTCGSGTASSTRNCDKPQPSHGGKNCVGERKRYKICAATGGEEITAYRITTIPQNISDLFSEEVNVSFVGKPCETGRPSFRDIQCGEFDDWIYPEDGKTHSWKSYFFHDDNPCVLYCINEVKQVAALKPRVVDGTMCFRGIRDICVSGICRTLPCDLQFDSNAIEDACGICHGDGTNCEFSEGKETFTQLTKGLTKLVNVPSGSRNIKVEEMSPTLAKIVVRDKETKEIYIRGKSLGMFNVPGSQAWLGMIKKNQEALNIPGPVTKPLSIWIQRLENVTVKWSMALPAEQQRKPEFAWDFLKWGPCSSKCGPGTQKSEPNCMEEKAGLVEDSFCADLEMPVAKVRQCEVKKCQSRWMVGDWKTCDLEKKVRKRVVYCIKSIGELEGESQIVSESECIDPKPHDNEPCENRQKREDIEYNVKDNLLEFDSAQLRPDTSEYGFHNKYEVYLKHFAALSVPQRNCETIPYHLVSSPHFKHYFHMLETPGDNETDSAADVDLSNTTSHNGSNRSKVLPEFLTETFSGQRNGFSHIHYIPPGSAHQGEIRTKKNLNPGLISKHPKFRRKFHKVPKMKFPIDKKPKKHIWFTKNRENSQIQKLKPKLYSKRMKKFNNNPQNLSNFLKNFQNYNKSGLVPYKNKVNLPLWDLYKLNNRKQLLQNPTSLPQNFNGLFSFFTKSKTSLTQNINSFKSDEFIKPNREDFDGSGLKRVPLTDNINPELENFVKKGNIFDLLTEFDFRSKKKFDNGHLPFEHLPRFKNFKEYHEKKKFLKRTTIKRRIKQKQKHRLIYKQKRSNRIWKKPKSKEVNSKGGKEPVGTCVGTETRNYLNNLFRDNHPKIFNPKPTQPVKPQEVNTKYKRPVIKEGVLAIDVDSPEKMEMEVVLEEDDLEPKLEKYARLPQPSLNERRLVIKGQNVFNFLHELQDRSLRQARRNKYDGERKFKISKLDNKSEATITTTTETTETTTITATVASTTASTTAPESDTTTPETTKNETSTTDSMNDISTTDSTTAETDKDSCDYNFNEVVLETKTRKGEKKKKKKGKKKEETTESFENEFFYVD